MRERGEGVARAKADVKEAMGDLERISLDIMAQKEKQTSAS